MAANVENCDKLADRGGGGGGRVRILDIVSGEISKLQFLES